MQIKKKFQQIKNSTISENKRKWLNQLNSPIGYFLIFAFLLTALVLIFSNYQQNTKQQSLLKLYGTSITQLIAQQLSLSLGSKDLISLRSSLDELIQQEKVINAIVYDVDNQAIVQAGPAIDITSDNIAVFNSPLTLDNILVGTLNITLDTSRENQSLLILGLIYVLLLILLTLLFRQYIFDQPSPSNRKHTLPNTTIDSASNEIEPIAPAPSEKFQSILLLQLQGLDELFQRLNASARQQQFDRLQTAINKILTLYSGTSLMSTNDSIILAFEDSTQSQSALNALCFSYLLLKTCEQQQLLLKVTAVLTKGGKQINGIQTLKEIKQVTNEHKTSILIASEFMGHTEFQKKFTSTQCRSQHFFEFIHFSENYAKLIESQLKQLEQ
jgi:uncharacterized membrane protein affecting hemolysin expression